MSSTRKKVIVLFDLDGTLTKPRQVIENEVLTFVLEKLKSLVYVGIVGGSNLDKITEQLGGTEILNKFDYIFSENGLVALQNGELFAKQDIAEHLGESFMQTFINACLSYMSSLTLPIKRGTFIEYRSGVLNVCPIGRNCSQKERDDYGEYDNKHKIREKFIAHLEEVFPSSGLQYAIGGQISFDVFPIGWDKSYCLQFLSEFESIYFYGDKCEVGGNDYEIYSSSLVKGHKVNGPGDTLKLIKELHTFYSNA